MNIKLFSVILLLMLGASVNTGAVAQDYILFNGGISANERAEAPTNGTKLVFFVRAGNFLSAVSVVVSTAAGEILVNTVTEGPWLILDLPNGRYSVRASIPSGETQSLSIEVDGSNKEIGFMFTSVE